MNKPKQIGTKAETAVARYLQGNGWPHAERRALRGRLDAGDITGTPGVCWSVKGGEAARNASDLDVHNWLADLDDQKGHARADVGVLVLQRRGYGPQRAGHWWTVLTLDDLSAVVMQEGARIYHRLALDLPVRLTLGSVVTILRADGYGLPLEVT